MSEAFLTSVSLAGLDDAPGRPWSGGARAAIAWGGTLSVRGVRLDAAAAGVRARDLDRSARRDLAALLRRTERSLGGLDLWIPPTHFADASRVDRAVAATLGAIELAGDLAALVGGASRRSVSVILPGEVDPTVVGSIAAAAEIAGVVVADHAWPCAEERSAGIGVGVDPATVLLAGGDPSEAVSRLGGRVVVARLSDANAQGRCLPGDAAGRLDMVAYSVAIATGGADPEIVVDLRGLPRQDRAATRIIEAWRETLPRTS
ncbi:MAG: hypothetical protein R3B57_11630 [Phycisphaerales bacterium]